MRINTYFFLENIGTSLKMDMMFGYIAINCQSMLLHIVIKILAYPSTTKN